MPPKILSMGSSAPMVPMLPTPLHTQFDLIKYGFLKHLTKLKSVHIHDYLKIRI